jgi:hypothetical protein
MSQMGGRKLAQCRNKAVPKLKELCKFTLLNYCALFAGISGKSAHFNFYEISLKSETSAIKYCTLVMQVNASTVGVYTFPTFLYCTFPL